MLSLDPEVILSKINNTGLLKKLEKSPSTRAKILNLMKMIFQIF